MSLITPEQPVWVQPYRFSSPLSAVQHVRRLNGGTQAHLMRATDERLYIVKFQNNPHQVRALASEFLASRLGSWLGLPMPQVQVIEVSTWLIAHTPELRIEMPEMIARCSSGLQLASRYIADPEQESGFDHLPRKLFEQVHNPNDFAQVLAFDKWTGNCDGRQAVFTRRGTKPTRYHTTFIDQHYCFNGSHWSFPDAPFMGTCVRDSVYRNVTSWESFEPVLSRIEQINHNALWILALQIPQEWYQYNAGALSNLIETLYERRLFVRELITDFRNSARKPFPNWTTK